MIEYAIDNFTNMDQWNGLPVNNENKNACIYLQGLFMSRTLMSIRRWHCLWICIWAKCLFLSNQSIPFLRWTDILANASSLISSSVGINQFRIEGLGGVPAHIYLHFLTFWFAEVQHLAGEVHRHHHLISIPPRAIYKKEYSKHDYCVINQRRFSIWLLCMYTTWISYHWNEMMKYHTCGLVNRKLMRCYLVKFEALQCYTMYQKDLRAHACGFCVDNYSSQLIGPFNSFESQSSINLAHTSYS